MKAPKVILYTIVFLSILLTKKSVNAQNTVITDSDSYTPHSSAMLDVYSLSKGLLVPRLTSAQRTAISTPAEGLLVYDTDLDHYYYFANSAWNPIDAPSLWTENNDTVYISGSGKRYGVGTASPLAKLTVQGDATIAPDEPLFEVKNAAGDVIFAVYENEVKVNFKESVKGVKGGFAVGGLSGTKADPVEYMRITPDSVRIYIDDTPAKGVKGGFAVGGLSGTKGGNQYFKLDEESASIYLKQPAKGVKGGFAVGGLSGTKGFQDYLTIERDSARMYINDAAKGVKGGFAVGGLSGTKAATNFLDLTPENYFIGQGAGANTQPSDAPLEGKYNQFFGYEAGLNNVVGLYNILIGYQAGLTGDSGNYNTFMGYQAGYANTGSDNTFIGYLAGSSHLNQGGNVYIGSKAGEKASNGEQNVYIGESSGTNTTFGKRNVFIGVRAGYSTTGDPDPLSLFGSQNVFLGNLSGADNTTGYKNIFIGNMSGMLNIDGFQNVFVGDSAGFANSSGSGNVYMGVAAGADNTIGSQNIFIGNYAGAKNTTGTRNIFIGRGAGENATGLNTFNVAIGVAAGQNLTASSGVTIIGNQTAMNSYDIDRSTFLGAGTGKNTDAAYDNTFIGFQSGNLNTSGMHNTYVGSLSGASAGGMQNVFMGYNAGAANADGGGNVFIGCGSGQDGATGANNVYVGFMAGEDNAGSGNVFIGNQVGQTATALSNTLIIDNTVTSEPLIYGDFATGSLYINGETTPSNTKIFRVSGGGAGRFSVEHDGDIFMTAVYGRAIAPITTSVPVMIGSGGLLGTESSSKRYKKDIVDMEDISWIYKLRPVNFTYKNDADNFKQYGLIAEEVEEINKRFVAYKDGQIETVMYHKLVTPLLKATQDQKKVIDEQAERITRLEEELKKLKELIVK